MVLAASDDDKTRSPNNVDLNGIWQFHYAKNPASQPIDFAQDTFKEKGWGSIQVPENWETQGYGYAIYLDERYPFTTTLHL